MPDYRRYRVPGGIYFFTVNLLERRADLLVHHMYRVAARSGGAYPG
jgi:putative transposase